MRPSHSWKRGIAPFPNRPPASIKQLKKPLSSIGKGPIPKSLLYSACPEQFHRLPHPSPFPSKLKRWIWLQMTTWLCGITATQWRDRTRFPLVSSSEASYIFKIVQRSVKICCPVVCGPDILIEYNCWFFNYIHFISASQEIDFPTANQRWPEICSDIDYTHDSLCWIVKRKSEAKRS